MSHSTAGRVGRMSPAIAAAVGAVSLLAACGGTTQPAGGGSSTAGSSSGSAASAAGGKTIVFSPLALKIPAMKGLSEGVKAYGEGKGYTVDIQDPNLDPQKQIQQLTAVIESGKASGVWMIAVQPTALKSVVQLAIDKKVPMVVNGVPADYGFDGLQPGITFDTIDYTAQGKAIGEQLAKCINEKLSGKAKVLFVDATTGTAGKKEIEEGAMAALTAGAPGAEVVTHVEVTDRAATQTKIGNALQGNPDVTAVQGMNDEGALAALGAFAAAGKELPCVTEAGGNDEVLKAVKDGKIYASVALQFQDDMAQSFDTLVGLIADPTQTGKQLTVPQKIYTKDS